MKICKDCSYYNKLTLFDVAAACEHPVNIKKSFVDGRVFYDYATCYLFRKNVCGVEQPQFFQEKTNIIKKLISFLKSKKREK